MLHSMPHELLTLCVNQTQRVYMGGPSAAEMSSIEIPVERELASNWIAPPASTNEMPTVVPASPAQPSRPRVFKTKPTQAEVVP